MTDTPPTLSTLGSLFTLKQALSDLRDHALRVRDTAKHSAEMLAGPQETKSHARAPEIDPKEGILPHLLSQVKDIEAILSDCDDFAESILVLTGKWHQEEVAQAPQPEPSLVSTVATTVAAAAVASALPDGRQEPTSDDEPSIALTTGIAELVSTIAGAKATPQGSTV